MRLFLVMLALLFGASPAFAQWLRNPGPVKPAPKAVTHRPSRRPQARRRSRRPRPRSKAAPSRQPARKAATPAAKPQPDPRKAARRRRVRAASKAAAKAPAPPTPALQPKRHRREHRPRPTEHAEQTRRLGVFAGIPPEERLKIQSALYWHGDYPKDETGDDRAGSRHQSFQKRNRAKITGVLTDDQRKELVEADDRYRRRYGWRVVLDPATGIRIGLPTKLVPNAYDAPYGTRWSSPHGDGEGRDLPHQGPERRSRQAVRGGEERHPSDRRVETSVLHDDSFFISGMQGLKNFAVRAKLRDGEVRGFTILYDQMMETIVEPVMVAMASAFAPFPERRCRSRRWPSASNTAPG